MSDVTDQEEHPVLSYAPPEPLKSRVWQFCTADMMRGAGFFLGAVGLALFIAGMGSRHAALALAGFLWFFFSVFLGGCLFLATAGLWITTFWETDELRVDRRKRLAMSGLILIGMFALGIACMFVGGRMVTSGWIR